jgi:uncharacterized protein YbbK (DUF523 family)
MKSKILVSACLMGFQVRYNGSEKARLADVLARWQRDGRLVIHCPELAAGLPVPDSRPKSFTPRVRMLCRTARVSLKATVRTSLRTISWPPGWPCAPRRKPAARPRC